MTVYSISREGKEGDPDFLDYLESNNFGNDLETFFKGGRYRFSDEQIEKLGREGLAKEFVEHMRKQAWNEVVAVRDLNYVRNKDHSIKGKQAFGRLIKAWDTSDGVGSTWGEAIGDFAEGIFKAPSTYLGFGAGKLLSKAATSATSFLVREAVDATLKKGVSSSIKKQALKEAAGGAVATGALAGFHDKQETKTREELGVGPEYGGAKQFAKAATVGAASDIIIGGAGGYLGGWLSRKRAKNIEKALKERSGALSESRRAAKEAALKTLSSENATQDELNQAYKLVSDLDDIFAARAGKTDSNTSAVSQALGAGGRKIKDSLDPNRVAHGQSILNAMKDPTADAVFSYGLSVETMRGLAAAMVDMQRSPILNMREGRITQAAADAIRDGKAPELFDFLEKTRKKYGLSKSDFSNIYLAEASRAGTILGFQSMLKRGVRPVGAGTAQDLDLLFSQGAASITGDEAAQLTAAAVRNTEGRFTTNLLRDLDNLRVSIMTSQPATTVRNVTSTGMLIGADLSDQTFKAIFKGLGGDVSAIKNIIPQTTAILRGLTYNKTEAELLKKIILEELPEEARQLYTNASRLEMGMESNSVLAKVARGINIGNTLTDTALKEAIFYGSLDRQFRDVASRTKDGKVVGTLQDWLKANQSFDNLPPGVSIDEAVLDANRMTMQDTFKGDDSVVAQTTKLAIKANRKVPFLVSTFIGIPFPRYLGNHVQRMLEYTPVIGELAHRSGVITSPGDGYIRSARQATGALLMAGGWGLAENREGEVDWGSFKNHLSEQQDLKPILGPIMLHMYIGDQFYRIRKGLPLEDGAQRKENLATILGGIPDFSFNTGILTAPVEAAADAWLKGDKGPGSLNALSNAVGDFINTYGLILAPTKDLIGQTDYDQAGAPYTRDLALNTFEGSDDPNLSEEQLGSDFPEGIRGTDLFENPGGRELINRATRSFPDFSFIQYTQSFNKETALSYYDIANPVARGKVDPALKQFTGITAEPSLTELEIEMSKYNLQTWKVYSNRKNKNANVDWAVRKRLAQGSKSANGEVESPALYERFEDWRKRGRIKGVPGNPSWDEWDGNPNDKQMVLEKWLEEHINKESAIVTKMFEDYMRTGDRYSIRGYVRNNYDINAADSKKRREMDDATKIITNGKYQTAIEYVTDVESINDEIQRRLNVLGKISAIDPLDPNV